MGTLDETHDPARKSFVESANLPDSDFPIQNLPFGVFRRRNTEERFRVGIAIGDRIFDVSKADTAFSEAAEPAICACTFPQLNDLMALGPAHWQILRQETGALLDARAPLAVQDAIRSNFVAMADAEFALPVKVGDFTDFYASIHHATNAGRLMRPENPLLPNYKHLPVAYHSRVSSIRLSGTAIRRPRGQVRPVDAEFPRFEPSTRLDYETELGIYIGVSSELGTPISIGDATRHVFGFCLLNDWSARDVQVWEYQPLGPFLAKNFATTVSPWVITRSALLPYRVAVAQRAAEDPPLLPHLLDKQDQERGGLDIKLDTYFLTAGMRNDKLAPYKLGSGSFSDTYWTIAQMIAHHTSNGCNLVSGDLLGSGTVSGPSESAWGSLLELTRGGKQPLRLPSGEVRTFLQDGDEIIMRGCCARVGAARIGFGECRGIIAPALTNL